MSSIISRDLNIKRARVFNITLNKALTVVCEPQEASQFCNCDGKQASPDTFGLMTIISDAFP